MSYINLLEKYGAAQADLREANLYAIHPTSVMVKYQQAVIDARKELLEIFDAIKELDSVVHLGDLGYYVRERIDYTDYEGNSWEHPTITKFSAAVKVLQKHGVI
jgi:hypothetical protein